MPSWRVVQTRKMRARQIKLAATTLILILVLLLGGWFYRFAGSFFQPPSNEYKRNYTWDGSFPLNLVIIGSDTTLLSFDPNSLSVKLIKVPSDLYLEVPGGYGSWSASSIYQLGEGESGGGLLLKKSLSNFFAVPIDGFLKVNYNPKELIFNLRTNPFSLTSNKLTTDLTPFELARLLLQIRQVRFDKVAELNLEEVLEETSLSDGTPILRGEANRVDFLMEELIDKKMFEEQLTVAIYNGTLTPGLAQRAARIISNMGGSVIIQGNFEKPLKQSVLLGQDSYTKKRLERIFVLGCQEGKNCDKLEGFNSRATLNLVLGEDFK